MRNFKVALFKTYNTIAHGNKGISVLTIIMLIFVFLNLLIMPGLIDGMTTSLMTTLRTSEIGDISVRSETGEPVIYDLNNKINSIKKIPNVTAVTGKSYINSEISSSKGEIVETPIQGINVDSHVEVFNLSDMLIEGEFLEPGDEGMLVMGIQVAGVDNPDLELYRSSLKNIHAGDRVTVKINGQDSIFTVKGIYQSNFVLSDMGVLIPEDILYQYNPMLQNTARSLHIKVNDLENIDQVVSDLVTLYPELDVESWESQAGMVETLAASISQISTIITFIALVVAAITILIVTYVDITNKRRHVGIERAIGIKGSAIVLTYVFRAVVFALLGTSMGYIIFTFLLVPYSQENPLKLPSGYASLQLDAQYTLSITVILFSVTVISATLPTLNAMRVKIVDAIWGN